MQDEPRSRRQATGSSSRHGVDKRVPIDEPRVNGREWPWIETPPSCHGSRTTPSWNAQLGESSEEEEKASVETEKGRR